MSNTPKALFRIADINAKIKSYEKIHSVFTEIYWKNILPRFNIQWIQTDIDTMIPLFPAMMWELLRCNDSPIPSHNKTMIKARFIITKIYWKQIKISDITTKKYNSPHHENRAAFKWPLFFEHGQSMNSSNPQAMHLLFLKSYPPQSSFLLSCLRLWYIPLLPRCHFRPFYTTE